MILKKYKSLIEKEEIPTEDEIKVPEDEKQVLKLIKRLKIEDFNNREQRLEFSKIIMQLAMSSNPKARKLISKLGKFLTYWQNDEYISEDEWHSLNDGGNV